MPNKELLTNSRASAFRECPRKHFYLYEAGIRTIKTTAPLRFGSQFHEGKYIYNMTRDLEEAIRVAIEPYMFYPPWIQSNEDKRAFNDERVILAELLAANILYWEDRDPISILHAEEKFEVPIFNPTTGRKSRIFVAAGKRDSIGVWRNLKVLVEYKTTSSEIGPDSPYWQRLMIDSQVSHYFLSAEIEKLGLDTVLYDVTMKPKSNLAHSLDIPELDYKGRKILVWKGTEDRVYNQDGETPAQRAPRGKADQVELVTRPEKAVEFAQRLRDDIDERPEYYFQRREIARTEFDIREYQQELWQIARAIRSAQKEGAWYKNGNICFRWHKTRPCPYWDACTTGMKLEEMSDSELASFGFERIQNVHPELAE